MGEEEENSRDDLLSHSGTDEAEEDCCTGFCYRFQDKLLKFYSYTFNFVAWQMWYFQVAGKKLEMDKEKLFEFTLWILLLLAVVSVVHYSYAHDLEEHAEKALTSKATPADLGAAFVDRSYEVFTDAVGYVLVEAWHKVYHLPIGHPYLTTIVRFSATTVVVLLGESCERKMEKGKLKSFVALLSEVLFCGGMWYTVYSAVDAWQKLFGIEEKKGDPGALACLLAFVSGIVVPYLISYTTAKVCHADGKADEDTGGTTKLCGEKVLQLAKKVGFYTAGYLYIYHDSAENNFEEVKEIGMWFFYLCLAAYSVVGALNVVGIEDCCFWGNGVHASKRLDAGQRGYWLRFQQDFVSGALNTQSFVIAMMLIEALGKEPPFGIGYWFTAIVAQIASLSLEYCRVQRLKRAMSEVDGHEDLNSDGKHSEHSE